MRLYLALLTAIPTVSFGFAPAPVAKVREAKTVAGGDFLARKEFRNAYWRDVFRWLAAEKGVPVIRTFMPTGTFTFLPDEGKRYTEREFLAIVNIDLKSQDTVLVRTAGGYCLLIDSDQDTTLLVWEDFRRPSPP